MEEMMVKAQEYIAGHYHDSGLSMAEVCRHLGISSSYFSTLFKRGMGMGFSHYITGLRLERAAQLLKNTDETAVSISYRVGYTGPYYFSRAFKMRYGVAPSVYRK